MYGNRETIERREFEYCGYFVDVHVYFTRSRSGEKRVVKCRANKINGDNKISVSTSLLMDPGITVRVLQYTPLTPPRDVDDQIEEAVDRIKQKIESTVDQRAETKASAETTLDQIEEEMNDG